MEKFNENLNSLLKKKGLNTSFVTKLKYNDIISPFIQLKTRSI